MYHSYWLYSLRVNFQCSNFRFEKNGRNDHHKNGITCHDNGAINRRGKRESVEEEELIYRNSSESAGYESGPILFIWKLKMAKRYHPKNHHSSQNTQDNKTIRPNRVGHYSFGNNVVSSINERNCTKCKVGLKI